MLASFANSLSNEVLLKQLDYTLPNNNDFCYYYTTKYND